MSSPLKPVDHYVPGGSVEDLTPEEEAVLRDQLDRVDAEKQVAAAMPGLSWRDWFLYRSSKLYIGVGLLIVDAWIVTTFTGIANTSGWTVSLGIFLGLSIAVALYAEALLFRFLWYRPPEGLTTRTLAKRPLAAHLWTPVAFGRWTPEAADFRAGRVRTVPGQGPDPHEFL